MSDIHALSGAYAVDALEVFERTAFERHLAHCTDCRSEVDGLREASALVAELTVRPAPAALRGRVLADVATVRPLPPILAAVPQAAASVRHRAPRRRTAALLVAAAAVVAVGVGGAVTQPWQPETVRSADSPLADAVLAAPDGEEFTYNLKDGGTATLVRSRQLNRAVVVTHGMASPPTGKVVELWFKSAKAGVYTPAGLLTGGDSTVVLEGDARTAVAVGLTTEKAGGSTTGPTLPAELLPFKQA